MASLLGKADPTLVAASFKASEADVPKDLSDVYKKREEAFKTFQEGMSDIFTNLNKEDKEWMDKFDTQVEAAKNTLLKNPKVNDHMLIKFHEQVEIQRERWKNAETELEKSQARAALNQFAEQSTSADAALAEMVEDSDLLLFEPGSNELKLVTSMLDDYNNNGKTTNAFYDEEKNDWVYTLPESSGFQMTLTEIKNKLGTKDLTAQTEAGKIINDIPKSKTNQPWKSDDKNNIPGRRDDVYNDIMGTMPKDNDVLNMGKANIPGQRFSVEDLLMGRVKQGYKNPVAIELFSILETLDLDKDGTPGGKEDIDLARNSFTTPQNGVKFAREIIKDKSLYKEIIANSWTDISGSKMANIKKDEKLTYAQQLNKLKLEDYIKNRDKGSELTQTLDNIVTSWQSGNFEDLALPHLNKIYLDKDGEFGENTLTLETSDDIFRFDVSKPSSLKKILMKYAGNNKSLQNAIEGMDFDKINFGSKTVEENSELTEVVGGGKGKGKVALKDDGSTDMTNTGTVSFAAGGTKVVKKINGEWHSWEGFGENKEWKKVKPSILKKIQKKYK